ncbi:MAG: nitroreductase [Anaerolineae bacterium]|jgi:nitroreductase
MELLEALRTRRSVRQWTAEPIPDEQLKELVEAAARAPSGSNNQPWTFVIIREQGRLKRLRAAAPGIAGRAAAVILLCLDRRSGDAEPGTSEYDMVHLTLGAAMQNLLLAAHDKGLGACAIGSFHPSSLASIVSLPPHLQLKLLVALGYPVSQPAAPALRPLSEVCYFEEVGSNRDH